MLVVPYLCFLPSCSLISLKKQERDFALCGLFSSSSSHVRALFSPCDFGVHQALLPHTSRGNAILLLHLLLLVLEYQELLLHVVFMKHLLRCHVIIVRFHLYLFYLFSLIRSRKYLLLLSTLAYSYHLVR